MDTALTIIVIVMLFPFILSGIVLIGMFLLLGLSFITALIISIIEAIRG